MSCAVSTWARVLLVVLVVAMLIAYGLMWWELAFSPDEDEVEDPRRPMICGECGSHGLPGATACGVCGESYGPPS